MLESAVASSRAGVDIVLGRINARMGDQLDHLLRGFEHLSNSDKAQIDVAAAIGRKPSILLIDTRPPTLRRGRSSHSERVAHAVRGEWISRRLIQHGFSRPD
jgi:hypothetical protein